MGDQSVDMRQQMSLWLPAQLQLFVLTYRLRSHIGWSREDGARTRVVISVYNGSEHGARWNI